MKELLLETPVPEVKQRCVDADERQRSSSRIEKRLSMLPLTAIRNYEGGVGFELKRLNEEVETVSFVDDLIARADG